MVCAKRSMFSSSAKSRVSLEHQISVAATTSAEAECGFGAWIKTRATTKAKSKKKASRGFSANSNEGTSKLLQGKRVCTATQESHLLNPFKRICILICFFIVLECDTKPSLPCWRTWASNNSAGSSASERISILICFFTMFDYGTKPSLPCLRQRASDNSAGSSASEGSLFVLLWGVTRCKG